MAPLFISYLILRKGLKAETFAGLYAGVGFAAGCLAGVMFVHLAWFFDWWGTKTGSSTSGLIFIFIPFAILPIIIRTFLDSRLAFFMHVITILVCAFFAQNSFQFVFIQIPVGLVAMFSLFRMTRRSHIVRAAMFIILTYALIYTALVLWQEGTLANVNAFMYLYFATNGVMLLMVYPLIWIFEKLFGFLSDVTLIELSDSNQPLLRKLAFSVASGTF